VSKRAWMPLYVGDYLGDTGHLTTSQHGAYLLLMMHYWRKGGLPNEDDQLSAITKLPFKIWLDYRSVIQAFFYDGWCHKRIDAELADMEVKTRRRALAGQKGGISSGIARMKLENAALGRTKPKQCYSNAQAIVQQSSTTNTHLSKKEEEAQQGIVVSAELLALLAKG
jgi:uncharacterized protein YdaU (DUF1376 family)